MSAPERLLHVPYHRQDCRGYCALGCVTMILDAHALLGHGGYSQVSAYTRVYRNPGPPGSSSPAGDYDRWHVSPWQLQTLLKPLEYDVHRDAGAAGVDRLLQKVRKCLDEGYLAVVLLSYETMPVSTKHHASGTHWVVVYGYSGDATGVTGYYTRDPWRAKPPQEKEDPLFLHRQSQLGDCPCGHETHPGAIVSWQRSPYEGPNAVASAGTSRALDLARGVFGGIRTDGHAYALTVQPHHPGHTQASKDRPPESLQFRINVADWPKLLYPLFIYGVKGDGMTAEVAPEFAEAMGDKDDYQEEEVLRTDRPEGAGYRLTVWAFPVKKMHTGNDNEKENENEKIPRNQMNRMRIVAWSSNAPTVAGHTLDGAAVVNARWPGIHPRPGGMLESGGPFKLYAPPRDTDWPELNGFFDRLESFIAEFNTTPIRPIKVDRLVWEPCIASLSPALPFYDAEIQLPAAGTTPALTFRALIDLEGRIHRRLRRSSKAGG